MYPGVGIEEVEEASTSLSEEECGSISSTSLDSDVLTRSRDDPLALEALLSWMRDVVVGVGGQGLGRSKVSCVPCCWQLPDAWGVGRVAS